MGVLLHFVLPLSVLVDAFLFLDEGLLVEPLPLRNPLFPDLFFVHPYVVLFGLLPHPDDFKSSLAIFLLLLADRFLALPLLHHLLLLIVVLLSFGLVADDLALPYIPLLGILALLIDDFLVVHTLDHLFVLDLPESFLLDSGLLELLALDADPLLGLLTDLLLFFARLYVCDLADADSFLLHLLDFQFIFLALADDPRFVLFPARLLF